MSEPLAVPVALQRGRPLAWDRRVRADLEKFKELVESRGVETGGWRGEVRQGDVTRISS